MNSRTLKIGFFVLVFWGSEFIQISVLSFSCDNLICIVGYILCFAEN